MVKVRGGGTYGLKLATVGAAKLQTSGQEYESLAIGVKDIALLVTEEAPESEDVGAGVEDDRDVDDERELHSEEAP